MRGELKLGANWLGRVAVLDGVPGNPAHAKRTVIKLSERDGTLVVGELNYLKGGTKAAIGMWGYIAQFGNIRSSGSLAPRRGNKGAYIFAEHRLTGTREDEAKGLAGWLRFGIADTRFNMIGSYLGGGLVYTGITPGNADDQERITNQGQARRGRVVGQGSYSALCPAHAGAAPGL